MSNSSFRISSESAWGTVLTSGWRSIEASDDGWETEQDRKSYRGLSAARGAPSSRRRRTAKQKSSGPLKVPAMSNGLGIVLRTAASTAASALHSGGTLAYDETFTWTADGTPLNRSLTIEKIVDRYDGTFDQIQHPGARCTGFKMSQAIDDWLRYEFAFDAKLTAASDAVTSRTVTAVDPELIFGWQDLTTLTLTPSGGSPTAIAVDAFEVDLPAEFDTEKWVLGGSRLQPKRKGQPQPTGKFSMDLQTIDWFTGYQAGTQYALSAVWTGPTAIEDTTYPTLTLTIPVLEFTGSEPQASVDDNTKQDMPFVILDNGTDPVVSLVQVTSDAAL